jgi:arylsulfatase A-like enzyme
MIHPRRVALLTLLLAPIAFAQNNKPPAPGKAKHVLIVVMDGLRRDSVVPEDMPTLSALAKSGTFFAAHHPAYLSTTEVNGTALATGMTPARGGVMANREYRPDVELLRAVDTQGEWASWKGDQSSPWIRAATLPELARAAGLRTAVAGTKPVAMMWDRSFRNRSVDNPTLYDGVTIPSAVRDDIIDRFGPIPPGVNNKRFANSAQDDWTTQALTEVLWQKSVPNVNVLWLSEPDFSQHGTGPGSPQSKQALRSSDDRLKTALSALEQKGVRSQTNVLVTSDHGFSTIYRSVDVSRALQRAGFKSSGEFTKTPEPGSIMVIGLGGSATLYLVGTPEQTAPVREKLMPFLQTSDWAGAIFTKWGAPGTFKLSDVGIDSPAAPDIVISFKWKEETRKDRMPGTVVASGGMPGEGTHGTLSKYDMANTLIANGPDFKPGFVNKYPSSSSDVAPTIAYLMGIPTLPEQPMDGRVLAEALTTARFDQDAASPVTKTLTAKHNWTTGEKKEKREWTQYLKVTTYAGRQYFDEGNRIDPPQPATKPTTAPTTKPTSQSTTKPAK